MLTGGGGGVKFAKILLTSYVNAPLRQHAQCTCRVAGLTCSVFCGCVDHEDKGFQNPQTTGTT